jgi:succinate dehydrogenase/fumarate reductase flavoprotein subunit
MLAAIPPGAEAASWLVCDHAFLRRYPFGMAKPFPFRVRPYVECGYLQRASTLAGLARACGIDADGLVATVESYNAHARRGEDPAFGRGRTRFNRGSGDPDHHPNPCVAPLERPPFYAIKVLPGSFGTFAGLATDANARVLDASGAPIDGLYAAGGDQANVMGGH